MSGSWAQTLLKTGRVPSSSPLNISAIKHTSSSECENIRIKHAILTGFDRVCCLFAYSYIEPLHWCRDQWSVLGLARPVYWILAQGNGYPGIRSPNPNTLMQGRDLMEFNTPQMGTNVRQRLESSLDNLHDSIFEVGGGRGINDPNPR